MGRDEAPLDTGVPPLPPLPPPPGKAAKGRKGADAAKRSEVSRRLALICAIGAAVGLAAILFAVFGGSIGSSTSKKAGAGAGPTPVSSDSVLVSALQTVLPSAVPEPTRTGVAHGSCNDFAQGVTYDQEHSAVMRILGVDSTTADGFIRAAITAYCPALATVLPH